LQRERQVLALSWPNLPCGPKAAIGIGKRTLGDFRQSGAPKGSRQGPRPIAGPGADAWPQWRGGR